MNDDGDHRQHPRFRLSLRVAVDLATGEVATKTTGISRTGLSVRLSPTPALEEAVGVAIDLPDGQVVAGRARVRGIMPGCLCGMSLEFDGANQARWDQFVDQEETTGSLWRMIGRFADAPDDAMAPRGITVRSAASGAQRFHTAGENGLAWRMAFHKHQSDPADESDLCVRLPGFREPARRLVRRVLREDVTLRLDESMPSFRARIVELNRGGYAYVQTEPVGLVSLGVGELFLVEQDGASVFPHFTPLELEQVACDTFRNDLTRPMFAPRPPRAAPPPVPLPPMMAAVEATATATATTPKPAPDAARFREGYDAVRFAQTAADEVQIRRYGDRDIFFHPTVWAKVVVDDNELMGPTLQDDGRACVLALVGPGAPRVVRLSSKSKVTLLKPPR